MASKSDKIFWQNREIRFDVSNLQKKLRNGELVLHTIHHIEDTKGNPNDNGHLLATNLRIIWYSLTHKRFNLSIGYDCITNLSHREIYSNIRGASQALMIMAFSSKTRFEFLFTDVSGETARRHVPIFNAVLEIYQLYRRTYLYRELKLRGAIIQSTQLILMPQEQVYSNIQGVWNLSSDQGNLGVFVVTNIRLVWFADSNEIFNISLPYLQISNIRIRESKYGPALVLQTSSISGGYMLGFRVDPSERLNEIYKELYSLWVIFTENPNFGITHILSTLVRTGEQQYPSQHDYFHSDDLEEIDEKQEREINSKLNAYIASGSSNIDNDKREPIYCKELGFAIERIRDGYKLQDLWDVIPIKMYGDINE